MGSSPMEEMDEIDRIILGILSENPRTPYSDIAAELEERGHDMSGEGIRYRVQDLFDATSTFFMLDPEEHDWFVLRLAVSVVDAPDAKDDTIVSLQEGPWWFISSGIGSFDIYAVATAQTTQDVDALLAAVRGIDHVDGVDFFLETHRSTDMNKYFPLHDAM